MSLLFNMLSRLVITFLPRSKHLLISWLQSPFADPTKKSLTVSIVPPSICHELMGPEAMILGFWMLSFKPIFHSHLSLSLRGSLVLLCFLPSWWWHLHILEYWYFSRQSWFHSQEFSPAPQFESINSSVFSPLYGLTVTSICNYLKNQSFHYNEFVSKVIFLLFNMLSMFVIAFLPRSKHLSGLQSQTMVNVWQKPLQYCKVISLQLIKINEK